MQYLKISLAAARVNAGLNQREAAKKLNIDAATLRNYEKGRQVPKWNTVKLMEQVYGITADYIFFGKISL